MLRKFALCETVPLPINKEELLLNLFKKHFYSPLGLLVGIFLITVLELQGLCKSFLP